MVGLSLPCLEFLPWERAGQPASFHFSEKILLPSCVSIPLSEGMMYKIKFTLLNMSSRVPLPLWWWGCLSPLPHESWLFIALVCNLFSFGGFFFPSYYRYLQMSLGLLLLPWHDLNRNCFRRCARNKAYKSLFAPSSPPLGAQAQLPWMGTDTEQLITRILCCRALVMACKRV